MFTTHIDSKVLTTINNFGKLYLSHTLLPESFKENFKLHKISRYAVLKN